MAKAKTVITPKFDDTFRAFKECKWSNLHTVLLGQDPYPGKVDATTFVADGLAFSSKNAKKCPKSLELIYNAVDQDIYMGGALHLTDTFDLVKWAKQGILLINCALTFPVGSKSAAHVNLWHPFITYVLKTINKNKETVAFGLFGAYARAYKHLLTNSSFGVFYCEHPSASLHKGGKWNHNGIFKQIDGYQKMMNNIKIDW